MRGSGSASAQTLGARLKFGLEGFAQLVSANEIAHSATSRIDMDRSVIDSLDADCGCADSVNAGLALAGLGERVVSAELDGGVKGGDLLLGVVKLRLQALDPPCLNPTPEGERGTEAGKDAGHHLR
jgi:hypothetical protein